MRNTIPTSPSVVVGIDGSRSALTAAVWAVQEAVTRGIPLRLVSAIEASGESTDVESAACALATAETALRRAVALVESADESVKVEVEILQGRPSVRLLEASRGAAMLCIGAVGTTGATSGRLGSTAAALATRALCPVAIIRGSIPSPATEKVIVVELDASPDGDAVLQLGIAEALQRHAPLVVISVWRAGSTDLHDGHAVAEQNRQVRAEINRRLACTRRRHPELEVQQAAVRGSLLNYLSRHAQSIQLVLVGRRRAHGVAEMIGSPSYAALHDTDCSVMICAQQGTL
jgi:nucleotide-binding universal stress UspA family protein